MLLRTVMLLRTAAVAALVAASLPAQKVTMEFDESIDFSNYKTYQWQKSRNRSKNPALSNELIDKKIRNAITGRLNAKGLREEPDGKADLLVSYDLGSGTKTETELAPSGARGRGTRRVRVRYTEGTLIIDLRDSSNKNLVWRAVSVDTASDPNKLGERLDKDVKKAFDRYPPKKK